MDLVIFIVYNTCIYALLSAFFKKIQMEDILLIQYNWWGNAHFKNRFWCASWEKSGEVHDYNPKDLLIQDAIKNGWKYKVIRNHRNGYKSVIDSNC